MFKKIGLTILMLGLMVGVSYSGGVTDNNNGNKGYILVSTGENNGANSVGTWTDPSFLKGEKGDTGATGATGSQGEQGIQGVAGQDGTNGVDGRDGLNGTNGQDGQNGLDGRDGVDGPQGEQGIAGSDGKDGAKGDTGSQGEQGIKGDIGLTGETGQQGNTGDTGSKGDTGDKGDEGKEGKKGEQGIQGERGKGLEDRYEVIGEVRLLDTKRTTWSIYAGRDFNNDVNIIGAKVTVKIGRSYYEKKIDALEARLDSLAPEQVTETITKDKDGNVVSIHMSNNDKGASFTHSF